MKITVKALVNVMGMLRGQQYVLTANDTVDALLDKGFLVWIDVPEPSEVSYDLTPEVLARVAADKKPPIKKSVRQGAKPVPEIVPPGIKPSPKTTDDGYLSEWELDGGFVEFKGDDNGAASEPEAETP